VDKKEQIIKAAMKLLTERGVQATPMSAIAKAANTGMGTIYNYFATKEELINEIYLYIKRSEVHLIAQTMDPHSSLKSSFFSFYGAMVGFYFKYPDSFAFMDQFHSSPIITETTRATGQQDFLPVISLVQQGQKDGIIKEMELDALLHFLAGTITTYVRWMQSSGKENDPAYLERQMRLVWDAIKE
jgi:AcrR family transcriptional regulator